jgi:TolA-binding protein
MKRDMRKSELKIIIFFLLAFSLGAAAQKTAAYSDPESAYKSGMDLVAKEKYGAAQEAFAFVMENVKNPVSLLRVNAEYYDALCAMELFNGDAEYKFSEFLVKHPANSRHNLIQFHLGQLAYRDKSYSTAKDYFKKTDVTELTKDQTDEYYFKLGYCAFKSDDMGEAKQYFEKARKQDSKYTSPSNYYLAHIDYTEGDYDKALKEFKELMEDENFSGVAPYYIVQILFVQEKYDEVLEMAPGLLEKSTEKRAPEIVRVIGESYYRTGKYEEALTWLRQYHEAKGLSVTREDNYSYGFTLYKTGNYEDAIKYLQKVTGTQDELSQFAYYYLGSCYIQTDQKQFAANAFGSAYKLEFDTEIREDALFNQAQLAFDLSSDPYNEAIKALKNYLSNYPNSSRNDDAYNFLFSISMATGNYKDAAFALEKIKVRGSDYNRNFQKISLYRGIELFNEFDFEEAIKMFKKAMDSEADRKVTAEATFWTADAFYRQKNYWGAGKYFDEFFDLPEAKSLEVYNLANYNLGYVHFKKEEYEDAIHYFEQFTYKARNENPSVITDAYLRIGDCRFVTKNYDAAIDSYDKAVKSGAMEADYAMFQKAKALGVLSRNNEKIQTLKSLIYKYPESPTISEATYELANTYLIQKDNENALIHFKKVISDYPQSSFKVKAQLKSGLIYYNSDQDELALSTFKKVVSDYPGTPEYSEALASIKNIYIETNRPNEYIDFTNGLPNAKIERSEQDSVLYMASENIYMKGKFAEALPGFEQYCEQFPEGTFKLKASFYLAECQYGEGKKEDALRNYQNVLSMPRSEFTETSLLNAANISFSLDSIETATGYYSELAATAEDKSNLMEANYGEMKCRYLLKDYEGSLVSAGKFLSAEKLDDKMKLEAMMIRANSFYYSDEFLLAKSEFRKVTEISNGQPGAEAKYRCAEIEFMLNDLDPAEKDAFELSNRYSAYDYWVAKGFILLADIYIKKGNEFQAKQTLQSIIDNYEGDDLREIAAEKLKMMTDQEKMKKELSDKKDTLTDGETIKLGEDPKNDQRGLQE